MKFIKMGLFCLGLLVLSFIIVKCIQVGILVQYKCIFNNRS
ncbi:hypothetical protein SAMN05428987_5211 [Paenibacillus sp. CF095]|nr:hypothetical protein SAMN05428987_5211 [Paenibacillus sp. CF095]